MNFKEAIEKYHSKLQKIDNRNERLDIDKFRLEILDQAIRDHLVENKDIDFVAFVRCDLKNIHFNNCHLDSSLLFENKLENISFSKSILTESQVRDGVFENIMFEECDLSKLQFSNNTFKNCQFIRCQMNWSLLVDTVFEKCILKNLDLTGVTVNNVQFMNCEILNCKSNGAYNISLVEYPKGKIGESDDLLELIVD